MDAEVDHSCQLHQEEKFDLAQDAWLNAIVIDKANCHPAQQEERLQSKPDLLPSELNTLLVLLNSHVRLQLKL